MYGIVNSLFIVAPIVCVLFCICSLFFCEVLSVVSNFEIISLGKREVVALKLLLMSCDC